jgi:hypothetical protein
MEKENLISDFFKISKKIESKLSSEKKQKFSDFLGEKIYKKAKFSKCNRWFYNIEQLRMMQNDEIAALIEKVLTFKR